LKDLGYVSQEEPFKKLINQGMIQGRSNFAYRIIDAQGKGTNTFVSFGLKDQYKTVLPSGDQIIDIIPQDLTVDGNLVLNSESFNKEELKKQLPNVNNIIIMK
jgi:leucyl-tRNA synthetase